MEKTPNNPEIIDGKYVIEVTDGLTLQDAISELEEELCIEIPTPYIVRIKKDTTWIWFDSFSGCTGFDSIIIPDSLKVISWNAFSGCTGLTSIVIPDSVTEIGGDAFEGCNSLISVFLSKAVKKIDKYAFSGCSNLKIIALSEELNQIHESAFTGCPVKMVYICDHKEE